MSHQAQLLKSYVFPQVFRGNVDNNTPYANSFTPPIKAQYVRLYPQICRRHCTLRMELLGCELSGKSPVSYYGSGFDEDRKQLCMYYLPISRFSAHTQFYVFYKICRAWFNEKMHAVYMSNKVVKNPAEII